MIRRFSATLFLLLIAAVGAFAQMGGMKPPTVLHNPALLMNPAVQKDLKLSPAVAQKAQGVLMEEGMKMMPLLTGGAQGAKGKSPADRTAMMKQIFAAYNRMEARTLALLTPSQQARLKQLTLQSLGASAALQPKVAAELGLTAAQKSTLGTKIATIQKSAYSAMSGGQASPQDWQVRMRQFAAKQQAAKAASEKALLAVLTPAQEKKWNAMLGKRLPLTGAFGMGGAIGGM